MGELIVPKAALALVIKAVSEELDGLGYGGVTIASKKPGQVTGDALLPNRFIRATRVGGGMVNRVTDNARILFECWSTDGADAENLANAVRGIVGAMAGRHYTIGYVRGVSNLDDGPTEFPDPQTPSHDRWQFTAGVMISTNP